MDVARRRPYVVAGVMAVVLLGSGLGSGAVAQAAVGSPSSATVAKQSAAAGPVAKPAGRPSVTIPAAVRTAVAQGPTDVLVGFSDGSVTARIAAALRHDPTSKANRQSAVAASAVGYAATKTTALESAGSGITTRRDYDHLPVRLVRVPSARALTALAASPGVVSLSLPQTRTMDATPTDLTLIHQPEAAAAGYTGSGVTVAVLDTGVQWTLPDVNGAFGDCTNGPGSAGCRIANFSTTVTRAAGETICTDELFNDDADAVHHHGTNVSGVVAEVAPEAKLDVFRVFKIVDCQSGRTSASDGDILAALNSVLIDAAAHNTRAVNLSLGNPNTYNNDLCSGSAYAATFQSLRAVGVIPVVAAGNDAYQNGTFHAGGGISDPACAPGALSVGAVYSANLPGNYSWGDPLACTDTDPARDSISCFSQTSPLLSLLAPGLLVKAAGVEESGTSQAAPHVAGAVADLVSANRQATYHQIVRALTTTGPAITDPRNGVTVHRLDIQAAAAAVQAPAAEVGDAGCTTTPLAANDDGSTGAVQLPFVADFFGTSYPSVYVNNNGNVTFQGSQAAYTPFTIAADTPPIIAPFFADVDTRGTGSGVTTYGTTTYGSRPAFCVDWNAVGYYSGHTDRLNSFQLLLVDRGDIGAGDFDIVMNYSNLDWETGDASGGTNGFNGTPAGAGYSAGDGVTSHFFQFPGSISHAGLLDTNSRTGLVNASRGSLIPGRYIFPVRNGAPPGAATLTGTVRGPDGSAVAGSPVQACPSAGGSCVVGFSGTDGHYTIVGVNSGDYTLTARPPAGSNLLPGRAGPVTVGTGSTVQTDLNLTGPTPPPAGTTMTDHGTSNGIPVLYWTDPITLNTTGCADGTAGYTVTRAGGTIRSGSLRESPAHSGRYTGSVDAFYPISGDAQVTITFSCPDGSHPQIQFSIYIDPSGTVVDTTGAPITGATVTLLRADTAAGPFEAVPDGSAVLSPSARSNPETTGSDGIFHWDVLAGFYQVRATKSGCHVPGGSGAASTSPVYEVPPPALGITLTLDCGESTGTSGTTLTATPNPAVVGQPVLLSAQVTGSGAAPGGTVTFTASDGSVAGCTDRAISGGQATCTATFAHATTAAITVTAAYSGDNGHPASSGRTELTVGRATPTVTWSAPAAIGYSTPLGSAQLDATASVAGRFAYTADGTTVSGGSVLHAGTHQLGVTFTPDAAADYTTATATVPLTVSPGQQVIVANPVGPVGLASRTTTVTAAGGRSGQPVTFAAATPAVCTLGGTTGTNPAAVTVNLVAAGTCTVTAAQAGDADWAAAAGARISFEVTGTTTAGPTLDTSVSADQGRAAAKLTSPAFSTHQAGELLVALVGIDGPANQTQQVKKLTGAGLTWSRAARSGGRGAVEVWQAWAPAAVTNATVVATLSQSGFDGSITVAAFTGAAQHVGASGAGSGVNGAPSATLSPAAGSLVWAVGHNWSVAAAVTTPASQPIVHQFADTRTSDSYWVQTTTTGPTGTPVTMQTSTPNTGRWQLAAVEIPKG